LSQFEQIAAVCNLTKLQLSFSKSLLTLTISLYFDTPTSISEIIDQQQKDLQGPYYNLNGQRVSRPSKGIYIVNGKKVIFK
jgi:hypothetical protein